MHGRTMRRFMSPAPKQEVPQGRIYSGWPFKAAMPMGYDMQESGTQTTFVVRLNAGEYLVRG